MIAATTLETRDRTRSTTRSTLLRLLGVLLGLAATASLVSAVTFTSVHGAAQTIDDRTAPAIMELTIARTALVKADAAAIGSVRSSAAQLVGPGEEFQNQIAIAGQALTKIAETNMLGEEGSRSLQFVEGLLVTYTGLISEATAPSGEQMRTDSVAALWSASRLLHKADKDSGILAKLDEMTADHQRLLNDEHSTNAMTLSGTVALFTPIAALLAMTIVVQVFWRRRFRRKYNLWLVGATALGLALAVVSALVFVSGSRLDTAADDLRTLIAAAREEMSSTDHRAQDEMVSILDDACGNAACSESVEQFHEQVFKQVQLDDIGAIAKEPGDSPLTDKIRQVGERTAEASANTGLVALIYVLGVLLAAAILLGFRPRLIEYRYRPR